MNYNIRDIKRDTIDLLWVTFKTLSSDQTWDYWDYSNFVYELPGKWEMSFYVELDNRIVGYCINSIKQDCVWLHHIIIAKEFRGIGVGNVMLNELEKRTKNGSNHTVIGLKVGVDNHSAQRFYVKAGFDIVKNENGYITMKKYIQNAEGTGL